MTATASSAAEWLIRVAAALVAILAMDSLRLLGGEAWLEGIVQLETHYFYGLLALLLPLAFIAYPTQASRHNAMFRWLDWGLFALSALVCGYFFSQAVVIVDEGWEFEAPTQAVVWSFVLWALLLDAVRRAAGWSLFAIVGVFSFFPIITGYFPGPIAGLPATFAETAAYHFMSMESVLGVPFRAFANLVIGFLIFGVALQRTGGGRFFIDLANALLGSVRGGSAKVAIVASGLMGSMSGSVITNVLTTGQLTIPAMKKSGFKPEYAAGVEACASTGGVLLPPIMGSTAFVMATMLEVPYYQVALAAAIPALLYFFGLFVQVDLHAAAENLQGMPKSETGSVVAVLKAGWFYLGSFLLLIFLLLYLQREAVAPYYATAALLVLNQLSPEHRWGLDDIGAFLGATGRLLIEILTILAGVGFIIGSLSLTGLSGTLVNDLLFLAGGSIAILLLMGAVTSFVLGIGMTVTAAYVFLAVVLAPALIQGGLAPMAVHLFILYWAMLSFITPPVALGAIAAASIAGAPPVRTGFRAMTLGAVIYFIPFFFVLNPALILADGWAAAAVVTSGAVAALWLIAVGLQGYAPIIGRRLVGPSGAVARVALVAAGFSLGLAFAL